jgi:hypothetical protein
MQDEVLRITTPLDAVPSFDRDRAAGNGGWNFMQPTEIRGANQAFHLHLRHGTPQRDKLDTFLRLRTDREGNTLLSYFVDPPPLKRVDDKGGESWCYRFEGLDEMLLLENSVGPWA